MGVVALDAGGASLKASLVELDGNCQAQTPVVLANHVATAIGSNSLLLGEALVAKETQRTKLQYLRPVERGYCVNWNVETELWTHLFSQQGLGLEPSEHSLVVTSPLFAPSVLQETMDQVVFEEFGFQSYARVPSADMCVLSYKQHCKTFAASSCHLVVDSGFSFTHIVPVIDGRAFLPAVKRINVGGKLLTNYLKEIVSFRQLNVMDDAPLVNELKEALCFCSTAFDRDMKRTFGTERQRTHWLLPDFVQSFHGRECDLLDAQNEQEQTLELGLEMISVPEVLFHPSDIGLDQAGVAEAIMQAVNACPEALHGALLENILLVGGNTKFRNFQTRVELDLQPLVPAELAIRTHAPKDPILSAWEGCTVLAQNKAQLQKRLVTKQEYEEHGSAICFKRITGH